MIEELKIFGPVFIVSLVGMAIQVLEPPAWVLGIPGGILIILLLSADSKSKQKPEDRPSVPRSNPANDTKNGHDTSPTYDLHFMLNGLRLTWTFDTPEKRQQFLTGFYEGVECHSETLKQDGLLAADYRINYRCRPSTDSKKMDMVLQHAPQT
ncbi:MAG: hypothetical protein OXC68_09385 [Aestuariivita sp.]|nr:hypothetical protein [Aestuariivita sp.]